MCINVVFFYCYLSQQLRPVNLGQYSRKNATLAHALRMEEVLPALRKHVCLRTRENEVCHINIKTYNHEITRYVFQTIHHSLLKLATDSI